MKLVPMSEAQMAWLREHLQNPLNGNPDPSFEESSATEFRHQLWEELDPTNPHLDKDSLGRAVRNIQNATQLASELQDQKEFGSPEWHKLETIDDRLFEALGALGE